MVEIKQLAEKDIDAYFDYHNKVFPAEWETDEKTVLPHLREEENDKELMGLVGIVEGDDIVAANMFSTLNASIARYPEYVISVPWFVGIVEQYRGKGLSRKLIQESDRISKQKAIKYGALELKATVIEVNDPEKMSEEDIRKDVMDPNLRQAIYFRMGFRKVPKEILNFIEPTDEGEPDRRMSLMIRNNEDSISKNELKLINNALTFAVARAYGIKISDYRRSPGYLDMKNQLEKIPDFIKWDIVSKLQI